MKLVGYQEPTCLCVKMEFVIGNMSGWTSWLETIYQTGRASDSL